MIRTIRNGDYDSILRIATESGLFESDQVDVLRQMLEEPGAEDQWLVSEQDGQLLGVAYFAPEKMTRGTWNLYFIAVLPRSQRQGVGAALVEHISGWLSERGERLLLVETAGLDDFEYVRRFYQSHQFQPTAVIPGFYDDGVDKVVFIRRLQ